MRVRLTVRGEGLELRGYKDFENPVDLVLLSKAMEPFGVVVASMVDDNWNPFVEEPPKFVVGDLDPTGSHTSPTCKASSPHEFACTREAGHQPPHVAGTGVTIVDVW